MTRRRHLVLIGLMGAGKTTVGTECATRLARPFVDTDQVVEATTGSSIGELFGEAGESRFRELERQAVRDACASPDPIVIACGGGAVLDPENRRRLRVDGFVVWLKADPDVLAARVDADETDRPLLGTSAATTLERLATVRATAYEATADVVVEAGRSDVKSLVDAVLEAYGP